MHRKIIRYFTSLPRQDKLYMGGEGTLVEHLKRIASSGGKARALKLSDKRRRQIAKKASRSRKLYKVK